MTTSTVPIPPRHPRRYFSEQFRLTSWAVLEPYIQEIIDRPINSLQDLEKWIADIDEMDRILGEDARLRRINLTRNTQDPNIAAAYEQYINEILPKLSTYTHLIHLKLTQCAYYDQLDKEKYFTHLRYIQNSIKLYREENIALSTQLSLKEKEYRVKIGNLTINLDGQEITFQKAAQLLTSPDRNLREKVFHLVGQKWLSIEDELDTLYDEQLVIRHQIALNAGFENYRDYKFAAMGRYDYTPADCMQFHQAVASEITPLYWQTAQKHKDAMGVNPYRPWDVAADPLGRPPLKPFSQVSQLIQKSIECLTAVSPQFGQFLQIMQAIDNLDLESRKGKAPGGYNSTLPESGVPFIFMNAVGTSRDIRTMVHESGHATHTFLCRNLPINTFKAPPSEVAELAAMSMELLTMEHWEVFFEDESDLIRAKIEQLEQIVHIFGWVSTVDSFQQWVYTHPNHTRQERRYEWARLQKIYSASITDWTGLEHYKRSSWHKQLHIFEVPFYYIEYAMAQLGAVAMWKQYRENPQQAVENYRKALEMGYTRPIPEIYQTAGIKFDFSKEYIHTIMQFLNEQLQELYTIAAQNTEVIA